MATRRTLNWIVAVLGVWEIVASFILGFSGVTAALWNSIIVGIVLLVLSAWAALSDSPSIGRGLTWINAVVGVWFFFSPFILAYSGTTIVLWDSLIVGAIVVILDVWGALAMSGMARPQM
jgi:hypothetical protein